MSDFYVGNRATSFSEFPEYKEYTRVSLYYDSETLKATVGNDTGREMVLVSPFLPTSTSDCDKLAQNILNELSGFNYQPFKANGAELDPSADLGDTLTVCGIESFIGQLDTTFNQAFISDISTPSGDDIEHEYPYVSQEQRQIEREISTTRSMITTTAEEIRLEVSNELNGLSSSIDVKLGSITSTVQGLDSTVSSIEQKVDSIKIDVTTKDGVSTIELTGTGITASSATIDLSGFVTFTGLSGGTTTIDGACIKTGTISAERINLTGSITWGDLSTSVQNKFGDGLTEDDVRTLITGELVLSPTIAGGKFTDLKQKNWIEMGQVQTSSGVTTVAYFNHYCSGYSTSNPVFVMGYTNPTTSAANWVMAPFNTIVLDYLKTNETMYASGNWDFSGATVTGLGIDTGNVKVVPVWG